MKRLAEPNEDYFLTCMDPGGDTGLSLFHVRPDSFEMLEYATVPYAPRNGQLPTTTLIEWRLDHPGAHRFVYEGFHLRNTKDAAAKDLTALSVIGGVEQMLHDRNPYEVVVKQKPDEAKTIATDEKLELLGLHLGHQHHQRHVRDANRHGVTYLVRQRYLPVCRVAYARSGVRSRPSQTGSRC